jgi:hypothetical protein
LKAGHRFRRSLRALLQVLYTVRSERMMMEQLNYTQVAERYEIGSRLQVAQERQKSLDCHRTGLGRNSGSTSHHPASGTLCHGKRLPRSRSSFFAIGRFSDPALEFWGAFPKLVARAGVPKIRLHDLRDTHASLLAAAGQPLDVISRRLGHSSIAITAERYVTVYTDRDAAASAAFASALR